jgi:hypothetical protein
MLHSLYFYMSPKASEKIKLKTKVLEKSIRLV